MLVVVEEEHLILRLFQVVKVVMQLLHLLVESVVEDLQEVQQILL
jgi:hypothetical protein